MVRYVGLDVHLKMIVACVLSAAGKVLDRCRIQCEREAIEAFATEYLSKDDRVCLESTFNCWPIVDILQERKRNVVVANPMQVKLIAKARVKTDKIDAEVLAQLLRTDFLPTVWIPDMQTRELRRICSRRANLVSDRTAIKNRIHAILHNRLIRRTVPNLVNSRGLAWLRSLPLEELGRSFLDSELRLLKLCEEEIAALDEVLAKRGYEDERVKLLVTMPGVDVSVAQTIVGALGDVSRFEDGDHMASYFGLVPSTYQSAESCYHGHITKRGNSSARWMLTQAAQHIGQNQGPLGHFFRKLAKKSGRNVAVVATARKMAVIAWHMLTKGESYRYATPSSTQAKLIKLRVRATGKRRKPALKGKPRSSAYGTGKSTKAVPGLNQLYTSEGIAPALAGSDLPKGEQRYLESIQLESFAVTIQHPKRVRRGPRG